MADAGEHEMLQVAKEAEGKPVLTLPGTADLTISQELKAALQSALAGGAGIDIDAGQVEKITTPCLQIVVSGAAAFAEAGGPAMRITNASPIFARAVSDLDFASVLILPESSHE